MGILFFLGALLIFGIAFLWGWLRGLKKTRFRGLLMIGSFFAAILTTVILKNSIATESFLNDTLLPMFESMLGSEMFKTVEAMFNMSHTLTEVLLGCVSALVAPILCVLLFALYSMITWVVFSIVCLCNKSFQKKKEPKAKLKLLRIAAWAFGQMLIVVSIIMIPVSVYSGIFTTIMTEVVDSEIVKEEDKPALEDVVDNTLTPLDQNPMTVVYRTLGGKLVCNLITDFEVNGNNTHLHDEVGAVTSFACDIVSLTKTKVADFSNRESKIIESIAESFDRSVLLPAIASEVVYNATDAWLSGEEFLGMKQPKTTELFDPLITKMFEVFHNDSKDMVALKADVLTLADLVSVLSKHNIFANLSNTDALMAEMNGADAINDLVKVLNANSSMKVLVPEVTNLGLRAMASTLGIPAEQAELYDGFMNDMTGSLNGVQNLPRDEQINSVSDSLEQAFLDSDLEVDREIIEKYATSMVDDLLASKTAAGETVTEDDMNAFFLVYAVDELEKAKQEGKEIDPEYEDYINNMK